MTYFRRMLRMGLLGNSQGVVPYAAEAEAIFAAFSTPPSDAEKTRINTAVVAMKSAGIWSKLSWFYGLAAEASQAATINWVSPGTFTLTIVNSMSFAAGQGFTGNGTNSYLNTGWDPSSNGGSLFTQNSLHVGVWVRTAGNGSVDIGRTSSSAPILIQANQSGLLQGRANNSFPSAIVASAVGHSAVMRNGATTSYLFKNGRLADNSTGASAAPDTEDLFIGRSGSSYTTDQISCAHAGAALTETEMLTLYDIIADYVGAASNAWNEMPGVWTWFNSPEAVRYTGTRDRTYFGYVDPKGSVWVAALDHDDDTVETFKLADAFEDDDHDNASVAILGNGKIMCSYARHGVDANSYVRISDAAEDISSFTTQATAGAGTVVTYSQVEVLSDESNKVHMFLRPDFGSGIARTLSTDNGSTWGSTHLIIENTGERPYWRTVSDGVERIHIAFTDGHPNEVTNNSLYHCYYEAGNWYETDGTLIRSDAAVVGGSTIAPSEATLVYDSVSTTYKSWVHNIRLDGSGNPIIVFAVFVNAASDHRYYYAHWNGASWDVEEVCTAGGPVYAGETYYSGGIGIYDVNTLYCVRSVSSKWGLYKATKSGTWSTTLIEEHASHKYLRPVIPRGTPHSTAKVLTPKGSYASFTNFTTAIYRWST